MERHQFDCVWLAELREHFLPSHPNIHKCLHDTREIITIEKPHCLFFYGHKYLDEKTYISHIHPGMMIAKCPDLNTKIYNKFWQMESTITFEQMRLTCSFFKLASGIRAFRSITTTTTTFCFVYNNVFENVF